MKLEIIDKNLSLLMHGFSGTAMNKDHAGTAFQLMGKMWPIVKSNGLKNKGRNIWVYEQNDIVFAGVELDEIPKDGMGLEQKDITIIKYAYYKHIGPYSLIKQTGQKMKDELKDMSLETIFPYVEIYGHWTNDETRLETELIMCLK